MGEAILRRDYLAGNMLKGNSKGVNSQGNNSPFINHNDDKVSKQKKQCLLHDPAFSNLFLLFT